MKSNLKVWIYCRVLSNKAEDLLDEQEKLLKEFAYENDMEIVGKTKEVSNGKGFTTRGFQNLISHIMDHTMDAILFYDPTRISVYDDLYAEFELICQKYKVYIIPYKSVLEKSLKG